MRWQSRVEDIVEGASAVVIGGADNIDLEWCKGFQKWIRVNDHWRRQGGRVDAAYTRAHAPGHYNYNVQDFVCYDVHGPHLPDWIDYCSGCEIPLLLFDTEIYREWSHVDPLLWCKSLTHCLGTMPLTGIMAIAHMLTLPFSRIGITGFTFYADPTIPDKRHSHELRPQVEWLKAMLKLDPRLEPDAALVEVLERYGKEVAH